MEKTQTKKEANMSNGIDIFEGFQHVESVKTTKEEISQNDIFDFKKDGHITGIFKGVTERRKGKKVELFITLQIDAKGKMIDVPAYLQLLEFVNSKKAISGSTKLLFQWTGKVADGKMQFNRAA